MLSTALSGATKGIGRQAPPHLLLLATLPTKLAEPSSPASRRGATWSRERTAQLYALQARIEFDKPSRPDAVVTLETVYDYHDCREEIPNENNSTWEQLRLTPG